MPLIFVLWACTALVLAACGDTPTGPGTAPTAYVTTASVTDSATGPTTGAPVTTSSPSLTVAPTTVATTTAASTTAPPPTAATLDVSKASATVKDLPFLKGVRDAFLSPDGSLVAVIDAPNKQICFYTIAGQKQVCSPFSLALDFNSVVWSPDSRYLAYTENFVQNFNDPDIWLLEVATGTATDLTEDNTTKIQLGKPTPGVTVGLIDQLPVFTPDSKRLLFLRYPEDPPITPQLFSIDLPGGKPVKIGEFEQSVGLANTFGYAISPDGKQIAYTVAQPKAADVKNGLWLGDQTGRNTLQLLSSPDIKAAHPEIGQAYIIDAAFSGDGKYLSALARLDAGNTLATYDQDNVYVYTSAGKRVTPLDPDTPVHWLAWSPSGSAILALVRDGQTNLKNNVKKAGIYLLDKPGGQSVRLLDGDYIPPSMGALWRGLSWAGNNTALIRGQKDLQLHLLQIKVQ
jgi:WD40 repeat protein